MDPTIFTARLKLTLITKADRGSPELEWLHELRSNEKTTWWSIHGQTKNIADTEKIVKTYLPTNEGEEKTYRINYAVHRLLESQSMGGSVENESQSTEKGHKATEFIGLVTLASLHSGHLVLPEEFALPGAAGSTTLTLELAYMFLPKGWSKGYATEAVEAVFESCKRTPSSWNPFSKIYVRAVVNDGNPASLRVMEKTGITKMGVYEWTGKAVFIGGEWQERTSLHVFAMCLLERQEPGVSRKTV